MRNTLNSYCESENDDFDLLAGIGQKKKKKARERKKALHFADNTTADILGLIRHN